MIDHKWKIFLVLSLLILLSGFLASDSLEKRQGDGEDSEVEDYNVVLVTVEALRADRIGFNGYPRNTSPNIDRLASESVVFTNATAPSASTIYSMPSVFTSLYPETDGVVESEYSWDTDLSLVGDFKQEGYKTQAVVANTYVKSDFGFDRYFDRFDDEFETGKVECDISPSASYFVEVNKCFERRTADETTRIAEEFLEAEEPFFLWLHYFDPHSPYMPPEREYVDKFQSDYTGENITKDYVMGGGNIELNKSTVRRINDNYDSEVRYTDRYIGKLVEELKDRGLYQETIFVLTSDHGECLGEHDLIDHNRLHKCSLRVPLIFHVPAKDLQVVDKPVSTIDVFPTLLNLTGIDTRRPMRGENLFSEGHRNYQYAENSGSSLLFDYSSDISKSDLKDFDLSGDSAEEASDEVSEDLEKRLEDLGYK